MTDDNDILRHKFCQKISENFVGVSSEMVDVASEIVNVVSEIVDVASVNVRKYCKMSENVVKCLCQLLGRAYQSIVNDDPNITITMCANF